MSDSFLTSFLGALQASVAVLLTISVGVIASRFNLLKESSSRDISKTCVRLFLPALLITNVGSELTASNVVKYVPILIWAIVYTLSSMALGFALRKMFPSRFPAWSIPAICFNNTTALPLFLIQTLETAGLLDALLTGKSDTSAAAVSRAKSYFLVSSMVGNSLTFAIGPKLLDDEESPDKHHEQIQKINGSGSPHEDIESHAVHEHPVNCSGRTEGEQEEHTNETTSLLPNRLVANGRLWRDEALEQSDKQWAKVPHSVQKSVKFVVSFINAPLIGAAIGAFLGVVPPLHRAFFSDPSDGGIFKAWLTSSIKHCGELFATLQLVVVGAKLSGCLLKMKRGEDSGEVKLVSMLSIFFIRFILWPIVSIGVIYLVVSKTNLIEDDPVLWFVMMMMPTGPPATKLTALADVSGADEDEKMSIAKFVTISYAFSPIICFAVVGALKASTAIQ